ncbi:MAG: cysteine desulfurase family protein [Sumerlaeia bacterium]
MPIPLHYFDHAATTPLDPRVWEAMAAIQGLPLNPSSTHRLGQRARMLLEDARERVAACLGIEDPNHLVFTSGATEAANLAIRGLAQTLDRPMRVWASALEHSCVEKTLAGMAERGSVVPHWMEAGANGRICIPESKWIAEVNSPPDLICVMHSNNETGVLQDVESIPGWTAELGAHWLCDVTQSVGKVPLGLDALGADFAFGAAHKFYGPVGIGFLAGRDLQTIVPQVTGGSQESEIRGGTEPVVLAIGCARALELACEEREARTRAVHRLEEAFLRALADLGVICRRNGEAPRLPGVLNLSFGPIAATDLAIALDGRGCAVSPGAACSTGVVSVSPVLASMFPGDEERARGGLRISLSHLTGVEEVRVLAEKLAEIVEPAP